MRYNSNLEILCMCARAQLAFNPSSPPDKQYGCRDCVFHLSIPVALNAVNVSPIKKKNECDHSFRQFRSVSRHFAIQAFREGVCFSERQWQVRKAHL